jgi:hypothetical protein
MFARFFQILAVSAAFSSALISYASAADKRRVCSGEWTDMRRIGLSIGDCDLNDISDADLDYVAMVENVSFALFKSSWSRRSMLSSTHSPL